MRAYVFTDDRLHRQAGRFVWLAINSEKANNAPFLKRYPVPALPSFFVIDPKSEEIAVRWIGGATMPQLLGVLDDGDRAVNGTATKSPADQAMAKADRAFAEEKYTDAAPAYREALAAAPAGWPSRARAMESLLYSLSEADSNDAVLAIADKAIPEFAGTPTAVSIAGSGLSSAMALPKEDPRSRPLSDRYEAEVIKLLKDPSITISNDDRSSYMSMLMDARSAANDSVGAHQRAEEWSAFLDQAAAKAKTAQERMVYDPHRLSAYIEVGHPEKAVPMLQQSERDYPDDYNPPARLAIAYLNMKRWDDGLAASDRAMAKAYGPRKIRFYMNRSDLLVGKGDVDGARKVLEEAVSYAQALPEGQRSDRTIASLQKSLDKLNGQAAKQ